jgi:subtilase family serine protease
LEVFVNATLARTLALLGTFAFAACSNGSLRNAILPQQSSALQQNAEMPPDALTGPDSGDVPFRSANPVRRLCAAPATVDEMQCYAMVRTDYTPQATAQVDVSPPAKCQFYGNAYCPNDLQAAYKMPSSSKGIGKVVAIVDAFGYKHAAADLAHYRSFMGLKACGTQNKCLRIVNQNGQSSPLPKEPPPSNDWKGEQSLDLDMVSAICPNCKIILVQTNNNLTSNLYAGVKTAGRLGAKYISNSYGGQESGGNNSIFHQTGVVITASAGDNGGGGALGGGPQQPCSYTYVVCVGGTKLVRAHNPRGWSEVVWNDFTVNLCGGPCGATGSGCSTQIAKPSWQTDAGCHKRSESDISATAAVSAPVAVYNSEEGGNGWLGFGGTSVSAPVIAAAYALAGNAATQVGASGIWKHHTGHVNDVTKGNNLDRGLGVICASQVTYICTARAGFDGPTGWGTPNGVGAL